MDPRKVLLKAQIDAQEDKLKDTQTEAARGRGVLNDIMLIVIPAQLDQLQLMRDIVEELPD